MATNKNKMLERSLTTFRDSAGDLLSAFEDQETAIKKALKVSGYSQLVNVSATIQAEAEQLLGAEVNADTVRKCRELYGRAAALAIDAETRVAPAITPTKGAPSSPPGEKIAQHSALMLRAVGQLAVACDTASKAAGTLEVIEAIQDSRGDIKSTLGDIADHIASFAAPPSTPAARPGTALAPGQPQRAEDALQQLLGTALAPRGKRPTPEFATALVAALDQRVAIDGRDVRILQPGTAVGPTVGEQPRGSQASLVRDIETESRAFLAIVNELPAIRRTVDTAAVADHRKRIARYVEELAATLRFPGGPLVDRASFQVDGIDQEWSALKDELGVPGNVQLNRSLAEAENEEIESEAARGDAHLRRIHEALEHWKGKRGGSRGAKIARLMQQVRALEENTRQLEHAFDQAELGRSDRLSRRFLADNGASAPVQALLDWLAQDSRNWAGDLAKGDARSSVLATIIEGAKRQRRLLEHLQANLPRLVTVGHARVRRAVNEIDQSLEAIANEAALLRQTAAAAP